MTTYQYARKAFDAHNSSWHAAKSHFDRTGNLSKVIAHLEVTMPLLRAMVAAVPGAGSENEARIKSLENRVARLKRINKSKVPS